MGRIHEKRKVNTLPSVLAVFAITQLQAFAAVTIDFNGIPDGTPVSAGNPYAGILNLQAEGSVQYFDGVILHTLSEESSIVDGTLAAVPPSLPPGVPFTAAGNYSSQLSAVFLQPVVGVSFDAYAWRNAGYSYNGFDSNGASFSGSGIIPGILDGGALAPPPPPNAWVTFTPSVPDGGSLISFSIVNRDPSPQNGAFWVDNITFAIVPEPSAIAMLAAGTGFLFILARSRVPGQRKLSKR
ncbi:MAG: hypothetical protein QOI34_1468 [Verrucomicrobiota bacterium]|jgi:hypothetical protein